MSRRNPDLPSRHTESASPPGLSAGPGVQPPPPEAQTQDWLLDLAICLFLVLAVWFVFGQTMHHGFVYDDRGYVYENPTVAKGLHWQSLVWAFTHSHGANWHPLTTLSHMLDCQLFGLNPRGHHLINVLLHTVSVLLLFFALRKMTGACWRSAFVAAVFAVHPLGVESVAWVAERKDVLSGLFFMLTLLAYTHYAQQQAARVQSLLSFVRSPAYWLALLLFALGLLSKPMLVTLPFLLLLLDYWPLRRFATADTRATIGLLACEKIPFLLLTAADSIATVWAQQGAHAMMSGQVLDARSRMGNALISYVSYLGQMIYPAGLAVLYPHPGNRLSVWKVCLSLLVLLFISAGVLIGRRKWPYLVVGWLWYLGMLVPVIGLVQVGVQARADRYAYLPQIGLYLLVAWGSVDLLRGWRGRRLVLGMASGLALGGLALAARAQTAYWKDSIRLWQHAVDVNPRNALAHDSLGVAFGERGQSDEAIRQFHEAIRLEPDYADFHFNLGVVLTQRGNLAEAIQHFERALQLKPGSVDAHNSLGTALAQQGQLGEAIQHFERALRLEPDNAGTHCNLAIALVQHGKPAEALPHLQLALTLATAQNNAPLVEVIRTALKSLPPVSPQPRTP